MLVILAGAGASKAVSDAYPTTVEFLEQLPERVTSRPMYRMMMDHLNSRAAGAVIDIEDVLFALDEVKAACSAIGDSKTAPGYLFDQNRFRVHAAGGLPDLTQTITSCNHISGEAHVTANVINEIVFDLYHRVPSQTELSDTWAPLMKYLAKDPARRFEIFTTNYDLVIEKAVELAGARIATGRTRGILSELDLSYWNGKAAPEQQVTGLLTKLHGSVDWRIEPDGKVYFGNAVYSGHHERQAILYPGNKGEPTTQPYIDFHVHLRNTLASATHILVIGFAFRDEAIVRVLREARRPGSKLVVIDPSVIPINRAGVRDITHVKAGFNESSISDAIRSLEL